MVLLFIGFIYIVSKAGNKDKEEDSETKTEKYFYVDANETMHLRLHCPAIGGEPGEQVIVDRSVKRIPIGEISRTYLEYPCSRCVSDKNYEKLLKILQER